MTLKTLKPHDACPGRQAESIFLASVVLSMSAWLPACDDDDEPNAPGTEAGDSTGAESGSTGDDGPPVSSEGSTGMDGDTSTGGSDPTGDPPSTGGNASTGGDADPCGDFADTYVGCYPGQPDYDAEYMRAYCEYLLDQYAELGVECRLLWSEWFVCVASLSCAELEVDGGEKACSLIDIPNECIFDGESGRSLE